ncbi:unnamed protein product, partial [marine sediment metagenome]
KLFFEEVDEGIIENIKNKIINTREQIQKGRFSKKTFGCFFCGYRLGGICK